MMSPRDRDWRYWLATDLLLIGGLAGWPWGMLPVAGSILGMEPG